MTIRAHGETLGGNTAVQLHDQTFLHNLVAMSFKSLITSLPFLWNCASALPAGPGFWENGTSSPVHSSSGVHTSAAYNLIDTYDTSNWLSKFDVQDVCV
jgi:hypothetical protein